MRRLTIFVVLAVALAASVSEAAKPPSKPVSGAKPPIAQPQPPKGGGAKPATAKPTSAKPQPPKAAMPKGTTVKASAPKGSTVKVKSTVVASGSKSVKPSKSMAAATKATKSAKTTTVRAAASTEKSRTTKSGTTTKATTTTSATTIDFTATKVGRLLEKNSVQRARLEAKLLAAGYTGTVYEAAYGFKNFGQFNAAMNQVQNFGYSFDLLKVLMTGVYVDPATSKVYRAQQLPNGTVTLVSQELATNPVSTLSLGQAKQSIAAGAVMPTVVTTTATSPIVSKDF